MKIDKKPNIDRKPSFEHYVLSALVVGFALSFFISFIMYLFTK